MLKPGGSVIAVKKVFLTYVALSGTIFLYHYIFLSLQGRKERRRGKKNNKIKKEEEEGRTDLTNYYCDPFLNQRILYFSKDLSI